MTNNDSFIDIANSHWTYHINFQTECILQNNVINQISNKINYLKALKSQKFPKKEDRNQMDSARSRPWGPLLSSWHKYVSKTNKHAQTRNTKCPSTHRGTNVSLSLARKWHSWFLHTKPSLVVSCLWPCTEFLFIWTGFCVSHIVSCRPKSF